MVHRNKKGPARACRAQPAQRPGIAVRAFGLWLFVLFGLVVRGAEVRAQTSMAAVVGEGLQVDVTYRYYQVTGSTATELLQSMSNSGPVDSGRRYFALTATETGLRYIPRVRPDGCVLGSVGVQSLVTVTLPQWTPPAGADPELRAAWDDFVARLLLHERWHISTAQEAAGQMIAALTSLRQPTCAGLDSLAKRAVGSVSDALVRQNRSYDEETGHGADVGAVWPPR